MDAVYTRQSTLLCQGFRSSRPGRMKFRVESRLGCFGSDALEDKTTNRPVRRPTNVPYLSRKSHEPTKPCNDLLNPNPKPLYPITASSPGVYDTKDFVRQCFVPTEGLVCPALGSKG